MKTSVTDRNFFINLQAKATAVLKLNSKKVISLRNFWNSSKELLYLRVFSPITDTYLETSLKSVMELFCQNISVVNYFCKKVSSHIFDWVLNMPLHWLWIYLKHSSVSALSWVNDHQWPVQETKLIGGGGGGGVLIASVLTSRNYFEGKSFFSVCFFIVYRYNCYQQWHKFLKDINVFDGCQYK